MYIRVLNFKKLFNTLIFPNDFKQSKKVRTLLICTNYILVVENDNMFGIMACIQIRSPNMPMKMVPTSTRFSWESYNEAIPSSSDYGTFARDGLLEQISMTRDKTDYFWYLTE